MTHQSTTPHKTEGNATTSDSTPKTGTVVQNNQNTGELSTGAQVAINTGIGCSNVCCGPSCYCVPSLFGTEL